MKWTALQRPRTSSKKPRMSGKCRKRRTEQPNHVWVDLPVDELLGPLVGQKEKQQ